MLNKRDHDLQGSSIYGQKFESFNPKANQKTSFERFLQQFCNFLLFVDV